MKSIKHYNYVLIDGSKIYTSTEIFNNLWYYPVLENVDITIDGNTCIIEGDELITGVFIDDLDFPWNVDELDDRCLTYKRHWYNKRPMKILKDRYYVLKKRKHTKITCNYFQVIE